MARLARVIVPGYPFYITQRGNRRQQTFFSMMIMRRINGLNITAGVVRRHIFTARVMNWYTLGHALAGTEPDNEGTHQDALKQAREYTNSWENRWEAKWGSY